MTFITIEKAKLEQVLAALKTCEIRNAGWCTLTYQHYDFDQVEAAVEVVEQSLSAQPAVQPSVKEPAVWVRPTGHNDSGVAHFGPTCPPGWVGSATPFFKET